MHLCKEPASAVDHTATNAHSTVKPFDPLKPIILVLGSEGHGLRTNILRRCDVLLHIPGSSSSKVEHACIHSSSSTSHINSVQVTVPGVDSLNVSVAGGVLLSLLMNRKHW